MGNRVRFEFNLNKDFSIEEYKKVIKLVSKEEFDEKKLEFDKGINEHYYYDYHDKKNEIAIDFYWYPKTKELLFYAPYFSYAPPYCINLIKKVYPLLKSSGWGNLTEERGYNQEESKLMDEAEAKGTELRIWSVNLFSPEEVKKYEREKLLKAPCEVIEEWEDGAIFMIIRKYDPTNPFGANSFSSTYEERKKLREYLEVIKSE